ncbi:MAG: hypothetical protein IJX51_08805 [Clostridia bacterium]|nr:hypothetical protein [Clostridia bacterium]
MTNFEKIDVAKKKIGRTFMNNIGLFMSVILVFAVIVIMTTDIHLVSFEEITSLGLDFFLLLFCSYSMYVCCADTGSKAGLSTEKYIVSMDNFADKKNCIFEGNMQNKMINFCNYYTANELRNTRTSIIAVVGLAYDEYWEKYMHLDDKGIDALTDLTPAQKKAIKKANRVKPVKLSPEMILRQGRSARRRSPLEINPAKKKNMLFGFKFIQITALSVGMSLIAFDVMAEPSWIIFASVCLKLLSVILNGFGGYKAGYDNIVIDTVNYTNAQTDLMQQAIQYIRATTND